MVFRQCCRYGNLRSLPGPPILFIMSDFDNKAERQEHLLTLIQTTPGLRNSDLAHRTGVHRSTIGRDMADLCRKYNLRQDEEQGWFLQGDYYLKKIHFTMQEGIYMYLACRLMTDHIDHGNAVAADALRKISTALEPISPRLANRVLTDADHIEEQPSTKKTERLHPVLRVLTDSWVQQRKAEITYASNKREPRTHTVGTLLILPNAVGQSFAALVQEEGYVEPRTYRLDRIIEANLTREPFHYSYQISPDEWLQNAWGIWGGIREPITVVLRFTGQGRDRVVETRWHPSQETEETEEGLIVRFRLSEPREAYPWIRGWGPDVEVLEPRSLREWHIDQIRKMMESYGLSATGPGL